MMQGAIPVLAGFVLSNFATKIGANRIIARTGIPFLRI